MFFGCRERCEDLAYNFMMAMTKLCYDVHELDVLRAKAQLKANLLLGQGSNDGKCLLLKVLFFVWRNGGAHRQLLQVLNVKRVQHSIATHDITHRAGNVHWPRLAAVWSPHPKG